MTDHEKCQSCDGEVELLDRARRTYTPNPAEMTDGQLAEIRAAEMGGPFEEGVHGETISTYQCTECEDVVQVSGQ